KLVELGPPSPAPSYARRADADRRNPMPDVARVSRHRPWREAAKDVDSLRPMLLEQARHEDLRGQRVLDVGTGDGRLAFVAASVGARVIGVDLDRVKLMHARRQGAMLGFRSAGCDV